ncbi:MAG: cyclopropane-fatty-acyl-phospholipid synthase, partial [Kiritimatiellae bacterium]|nr:cyclopropane-fatty-acyl-phospholipid synthase [Kiritimatiellia bacterium]
MDSTQTLTSTVPNMKHLSNWDRVLIHAFQQMQGGHVLLTLHGGISFKLGQSHRERADLRIHDATVSKRILLGGAMAFAETFMEGKWSSSDLSALIRVLGRSQQEMGPLARGTSSVLRKMDGMMHKLRCNTKENASKNIREHYDLSNQLYATFLDPTLTYSAGIFTETSDSLHDAQLRKMDRLIERLNIQEDDHVLEIGSGWGACAIRMAQTTGCRVTSLTLSVLQAEEARHRVKDAGLEDRVEIRLQDYRDISGCFDHVISVEMIEAVGHEFLPDYFRTVHSLLKSGGRFALQAITIPDERYETYNKSVDFIRKHIFPGGHLPSPGLLDQLSRAETDLQEVDHYEFGSAYAEKLRRWRYHFIAKLSEVRSLGFDDTFIRYWHYE